MSKASLPVRSAAAGLLALALLAVPAGTLTPSHTVHTGHQIAGEAGDFPYDTPPPPPDRD
jgi:hypothetical protein